MESRKIKFKTLDNKLTHMEVAQDILIADLKNLIKEKMGMPSETQRLIFKGKQLKDDKKLSEYITADDEIVHLMTRMVETNQPTQNTSTTSANSANTQNQTPNQSQSTTTSNTTNPNQFNMNAGAGGNLLQGMLGNLMNNPNSILQMTSMILGDNDIDLNNLLQGPRGTQTNQTQSPNMNLNNLLNNILNPNPTASTGASNTQPRSTITQTSQNVTDNRNVDSQYPMLNPIKECLSNLESINNTWLGESSENIPQVPRLNYTKNILTSLGETLKNYYNNGNRFLSLILKLSDLLERESLVQSSEERRKVQALIAAAHSGFEHFSKATGSLQPLLNGLDYGQNPGQGHIRLVTTIGTQVIVENTSNQQNDSTNANRSTTGAVGTTGTSTNSDSTRTNVPNPMHDMLSQLTQPDNMRAMMSMVGNLLGNNPNMSDPNTTQAPTQSNTLNRPNANPLNNLLNQLLNNMGGDMMVDNEVPQNVQEYFNKLLNDQNARKTTLLKDIPENVLKLRPSPDFSTFTQEILSQFSVQEIILLRSLNLRGFTRLRRVLREKLTNFVTSKFDNDCAKCVKHITEIISQILIITENETDKMTNNNFNVDQHLERFLTGTFKIILNENLNDAEFELHLFNRFINFFDDFFKDLTNSYNSGKEGALNYLDYNLEYLLDAFLGKDAVHVMMSLDENILGVIIDEIIITYENKRHSVITNESDSNKMQVDSENTQVANLEKDKIFEIAKMDRERLSQYIHPIDFSEGYFETGLFKDN